jgi:hypothetical protein
MEYRILCDLDPKELETMVTRYLNLGWKLHGDVIFHIVKGFCQAIFKDSTRKSEIIPIRRTTN